MDLVVLSEKETPYALRGLRDVVASNGTITPAERRFIEVVAELHGTRVDVDSLPSVAPGEVAEVIREPHQRKRIVQLATIAAMVEGGRGSMPIPRSWGVQGRMTWQRRLVRLAIASWIRAPSRSRSAARR
jgi:hypothetical protein